MRTSKVGAISKAQKAQNIFLEKKLEFLNFFFRKVSHSAEKCKGGTILDLLTYILLQNIKKTRRVDPLGMSGFVGFLEKVKNERGDLWTKFALALGGFRIVSKKSEDCSQKKKSHCYSRAFFLKRKTHRLQIDCGNFQKKTREKHFHS